MRDAGSSPFATRIAWEGGMTGGNTAGYYYIYLPWGNPESGQRLATLGKLDSTHLCSLLPAAVESVFL